MKYLYLLGLLLITFKASASPYHPATHVIMVQPIIVQSDEGSDPASIAIPESLVDRAYSKANIDFVFFEPLVYNNTKARDGEISLDQIVLSAEQENLLRGNHDVVNMFFVNKVDGESGPLGRGMFGGNITFIALGNGVTEGQQFMEAFVIAHEVGHNLGLNHAVDDPNVPDSLPNIQGGGSFEDRIDPLNSLNNYQIKEIYKSPLVVRKIDFLNKERGQIGILDESFEPYFSLLQEREIFAFTGEWSGVETLEESRNIARSRFQSAVTEFSIREQECIEFVIHSMDSVFRKNGIHLFEKNPWRFIKVENWLCGGFAHTRGTYIILSQKYLDRYMSYFSSDMSGENKRLLIEQMGGLLIHEQVHSLQRTHPTIFKRLYTNFWSFEQTIVHNDDPDILLNQLLNPDAPNAHWIYKKGRKSYWIRVFLNNQAQNPEMGKDFVSYAYELELIDGEYFIKQKRNGKMRVRRVDQLRFYTRSFPVDHGNDHPNELSAYMFSDYFKNLVKDSVPFGNVHKSAKKSAQLFLNWLNSNDTVI